MKNLLLITLLLSSSLTFAQDIFQKNLYSADRIMENREKLDLTEAQAAKIKKIHTDNAGEFSTLKWDLDAANAKLKNMLEASRIDQIAVNKQMDEVLRLESLLKKKQLNTLVGIKNELTESQQQQLASLNPVILMGSGTSSHWHIPDNLKRNSNTATGTASNGSGSFTWDRDKVVSGRSSYSPSIKFFVENGNADTTPLYIIKTKDGEIEETDLKDINPNDIESINVLKGSTATFQYGEKGKNGVIIITLKKNSKYYFQKK
jgi:TonB-dependent SusC/RagA subfamily outer membrane receptor